MKEEEFQLERFFSLQEMLDSVKNNKLKRNAICMRAVPPKIKVSFQSLPLDRLLRVN